MSVCDLIDSRTLWILEMTLWAPAGEPSVVAALDSRGHCGLCIMGTGEREPLAPCPIKVPLASNSGVSAPGLWQVPRPGSTLRAVAARDAAESLDARTGVSPEAPSIVVFAPTLDARKQQRSLAHLRSAVLESRFENTLVTASHSTLAYM